MALAESTRRPSRLQHPSFISIPATLLQTVGPVTIDNMEEDCASEIAPHVIPQAVEEQAASIINTTRANISEKKAEAEKPHSQTKKAVLIMTPNTGIPTGTCTDHFSTTDADTHASEPAPHVLQQLNKKLPCEPITAPKRAVTIMTPITHITYRPDYFHAPAAGTHKIPSTRLPRFPRTRSRLPTRSPTPANNHAAAL